MTDQLTDPMSPDLGDWRISKVGWVTAVDSKVLPEPQSYRQVSTHRTDGEVWTFDTPSAAALHLNSAWKAAARATVLRATVGWTSARTAEGAQHAIDRAETSRLFDLFEEMIGTVMSSYAAVEAFCNSIIVDKSEGPRMVKKKKGDAKQMTAEDIERFETTGDKLKRHLPDVLGVSTPAGKAVWQKYLLLQDLRDAVTHFKRRDQARHADKSHEPTALHRLLFTDPYELPEAALELIRYFDCPAAPPQRWMCNPNWKRP